ncbi:hypothetical protein BH11MYX4_BH11MYX4_66050 [soil metagenome]
MNAQGPKLALLAHVRRLVKAMRPPSVAAYATFAIAWSATALGSACVDRAAARARADDLVVCPTLPETKKEALVVHGAKVQAGDHLLDPADVLVAGGEIIAVGSSICFRAVGGTVAFVDGAGATLMASARDGGASHGRISAGDAADLILVAPDGALRTGWHHGAPAP